MTVEGEDKLEQRGEEGKDKQSSFSAERRLNITITITRHICNSFKGFSFVIVPRYKMNEPMNSFTKTLDDM